LLVTGVNPVGAAAIAMGLLALGPQAQLGRSLVMNGGAGEGFDGWVAVAVDGKADVEECRPRDRCFVISNRGGFAQKFSVAGHDGEWLVFGALLKSERVDPAAGITGRAYLHVDFLSENRVRPYHYDGLRDVVPIHLASTPTWQYVWCASPVPTGTQSATIRFSLGSRKGIPYNGSRGWADDIVAYLVPDEAAARALGASLAAMHSGR
jgi:hypothetical protein